MEFDDRDDVQRPDESLNTADVIASLRKHQSDGVVYRKAMEGRFDEIERFDIESPLGAALYLTRGIKKKTKERWPEVSKTRTVLDDIAEKWPTNSWGQPREWTRENPRPQAMEQARKTAAISNDAETFEAELSNYLSSREEQDDPDFSYERFILGKTSDPDSFFEDPLDPSMRELENRRREYTKENIRIALFETIAENGYATVSDITVHDYVNVSRQWVHRVLQENMDEWGVVIRELNLPGRPNGYFFVSEHR